MPDRRAREQQVRDVRARDQQHERDRAHHREDHQLHLVRDHPVCERPATVTPALVLVGVRRREPPATACRSVAACSAETPGFSRAKTCSARERRAPSTRSTAPAAPRADSFRGT